MASRRFDSSTLLTAGRAAPTSSRKSDAASATVEKPLLQPGQIRTAAELRKAKGLVAEAFSSFSPFSGLRHQSGTRQRKLNENRAIDDFAVRKRCAITLAVLEDEDFGADSEDNSLRWETATCSLSHSSLQTEWSGSRVTFANCCAPYRPRDKRTQKTPLRTDSAKGGMRRKTTQSGSFNGQFQLLKAGSPCTMDDAEIYDIYQNIFDEEEDEEQESDIDMDGKVYEAQEQHETNGMGQVHPSYLYRQTATTPLPEKELQKECSQSSPVEATRTGRKIGKRTEKRHTAAYGVGSDTKESSELGAEDLTRLSALWEAFQRVTHFGSRGWVRTAELREAFINDGCFHRIFGLQQLAREGEGESEAVCRGCRGS